MSLPTGYEQLDSVVTDGYQCINTGIFFSDISEKFRIVLDIEVLDTTNTPFFIDICKTYPIVVGTAGGPYNVRIGACINDGVYKFYYSQAYSQGIPLLTSMVPQIKNTTVLANIGDRVKIDLDSANLTATFYINSDTATYTTTFTAITNSTDLGTTVNSALYLFSDHHGHLSNMSKVKFYSCQMYQGSTLWRSFVPVKRLSDNKIGLFDTVNNVFYRGENYTDFLNKNSAPINYRSFANLIKNKIRLSDGTELTDAQKTQMFNYLLSKVSNPSIALNVQSAYNIISMLVSELMNDTVAELSLPVPTEINHCLGEASARILLDKYLGPFYKNFTTPYRAFSSDSLTKSTHMEIGDKDIVYVEAANTNSVAVAGVLHGAGGGASGAVGADGDKNASATYNSGAGGTGEDSYIFVLSKDGAESTTKATGGTGGASVTTGKVGGNPSIAKAGTDGNPGNTTTFDSKISGLGRLYVKCGRGGGGGAGCCGSTGGTTGSKTYTGGSGNGYIGGAAITTANEWSDVDLTFCGGGGTGAGSNTDNFSNNDFSEVVNAYLGPITAAGEDANAWELTSDSYGRGGEGGHVEFIDKDQPQNSSIIGAGGTAGQAHITTDTYVLAYGGNGGNRGGFILNSDSAVADKLFAFSKHKTFSSSWGTDF